MVAASRPKSLTVPSQLNCHLIQRKILFKLWPPLEWIGSTAKVTKLGNLLKMSRMNAKLLRRANMIYFI